MHRVKLLVYSAQPNTFPDGFPPIPIEGYPTYDMRKSTVVYFVGNDTGAPAPPELQNEW